MSYLHLLFVKTLRMRVRRRFIGRVRLLLDRSYRRHRQTRDLARIIQGDVHIEAGPFKDAGDDLHQTLWCLHGRRFSLLLKRSKLLFKSLPDGLECSNREIRFDAIRQALLHCGKITVGQLCDDLLSCIHHPSLLLPPFCPREWHLLERPENLSEGTASAITYGRSPYLILRFIFSRRFLYR